MKYEPSITESETTELKKSLAELLRRIHLVEAWGRGVPLILENAPDTSFIEIGGLFITRFKRPSALEAGTEISATTPKTGIKTSLETNTKTDTKHQENAKEAPKKHQETLLLHLRQHPQASIPELVHATSLSTGGVRHHIDQLKRTGKLLRHGPTKGGYWEVIDEASK